MNTDLDLLSIAREIKTANLPSAIKRNHYAKKYPEFFTRFPSLFEACMDPSFDLKFLNYMLRKKNEIRYGNLKLDDADAEVYETLKKEYVYPVVGDLMDTAEGSEGSTSAK